MVSENVRYYYIDTFGDVSIQRLENGSLQDGLFENMEDFSFTEMSQINRNNLVYTWNNNTTGGAWTETQTLYAFYTGNPYIYKAYHYRFVNNNTGEDCFEDEDCFKVYGEGYLRLISNKLSTGSSLSVGGSSDSNNKILEVRITNHTTEVLLSIATDNGNLHPPGTDYAYFLTDRNGKKYEIISQYGWGGVGQDGYGNWQDSQVSQKEFLLIFPRVDNASDIAVFSLREGSCMDGCWNFYDVKTGF